MDSLAQIKSKYFSDVNVFEVVNVKEVKQAISSKASAYWHCGEELEGGWVVLAHQSPLSFKGKASVSLCKKELFNRASEA